MPFFAIKSRHIFSMTLLLAAVAFLGAGCKQQTPEERFEEAMTLMQEGQTARGVIKLKELVRELPEDPVAPAANLQLARYYVREANANKALEHLQEVLEGRAIGDPAAQEAIQGIVAIRLQLQDYDTALEVLDSAVEEAEGIVREDLLLQRAQVLRAIGTQTENEDMVQQALAELRDLMLTAGNEGMRGSAREELAQYYRQRGDLAASNEVYDAYIEAYPGDRIVTQLEMAKAINLRNAGQQEEAEAAFEEAAAAMRAEAEGELDRVARGEMMLNLARYHELMGYNSEARAMMEKVMGDNVGTMLALRTQFDIARMEAQSGNLDEAQAIYERMVKDNPNSSVSAQAEQMLAQLSQIRAQLAAQTDATTETLTQALATTGTLGALDEEMPNMPALGGEDAASSPTAEGAM
ncbi:MAG: hypothetical protein RLY93_11285 [Sumerlaeia bacterium]